MHNKIQSSSILITGGAGFIGSYVVAELLKYKPSKIIIIDNLVRGNYDNMKCFINDPLVEFVEGDIRDLALLEKCITGIDYVFPLSPDDVIAFLHFKSHFVDQFKGILEVRIIEADKVT